MDALGQFERMLAMSNDAIDTAVVNTVVICLAVACAVALAFWAGRETK